ncbi:hypothetical protein, partial [Xanthomonas translucens]|uniref:hypothetical protein n=1 Tax=Xanthomonas campestris pv. translucens TaxID=343 RepID=UPI0018C7B114
MLHPPCPIGNRAQRAARHARPLADALRLLGRCMHSVRRLGLASLLCTDARLRQAPGLSVDLLAQPLRQHRTGLPQGGRTQHGGTT